MCFHFLNNEEKSHKHHGHKSKQIKMRTMYNKNFFMYFNNKPKTGVIVK